MTVACNYLFITDNLLDPSHVAWVHRTSFGNDACAEEPVQTICRHNGVVASRWMRDVDVAPFYASMVRFKGRCDRLQHYEVRYPSHAIIKAVFVPAREDARRAGSDDPEALIMDSYNFMTPVSEHETRYFWFQLRNFSVNDHELSKTMDDGVRAAFAEDRVVLEAVNEGFRNQATPNLDLAIDRAPLTFRKELAQLIAAENSS
jgi:vanillate O-demethylase monooxygenase subunit